MPKNVLLHLGLNFSVHILVPCQRLDVRVKFCRINISCIFPDQLILKIKKTYFPYVLPQSQSCQTFLICQFTNFRFLITLHHFIANSFVITLQTLKHNSETQKRKKNKSLVRLASGLVQNLINKYTLSFLEYINQGILH